MDVKKELEQEISEAIDTLPEKEAEKPKLSSTKNPSESKKNPVKEYLKEHTHPARDKDDLLDIRIGNPLKRITEILEEIKKQKAFSFTLKGSLGIMGVALALSTFGILGGSKVLCDRGTQSYIGVVKQLNYVVEDPLPFWTQLTDAVSVLSGGRPHERPTTRLVLIQRDSSAIHLQIARLLDRGGPIPDWLTQVINPGEQDRWERNRTVIATGQYDACSRTLTIDQPTGVEKMQ